MKFISQKNIKKLSAAVILGLVALVPFMMEKNIIFRQNKYFYVLICLIGIYSIATSGLDILFGYTGQISFGHAGFFCIGAYGSVLLSHKSWGIALLGVSPLPPIVSILIAGLIAAVIGALLAVPASKLVFHFLSLLTIAFNQIMLLFVANFPQLTNGYVGITGIPMIQIFGIDFSTRKSKFMYFYLVLFFLAVLLILKQNLVHSRVGRGLIAIRENTMAANGCGVNLKKYKIISFAISAFYVGIAGALYAHMIGFISPDTFVQNTSVIFITMLLFGGSGNLVGPVLGAMVITFIQEGFQALANYRMLIYGTVLLLLILYQPTGIAGFGKNISSRLRKLGGAHNGDARS
ncbi:MAG TPA: hypothetical protein DD738_10260 [Ruminiclostridium sp.]|jgi:branched-chain amino acid transport system permease protein|nr:hypothetical protein [Ruminiclostridium sp.]